jgi:hypothetical protein
MRQLLKDGHLAYRMQSTHHLIEREDLERYLAAGGFQPKPPRRRSG